MNRRRIGSLVAGVAIAIALAPLTAGSAHADSALPFNDPNVKGALGFCDKNDKAVTSGKITEVPFVAKAVSSTPAPKAWAVKDGKAALYAFSPVKNVSPGEWSPYQMTVSSFYSNTAHPMTQGTYRDAPLEYQTTGFPPTFDGLVQLRMYYSAPNQQPYVISYPAAVVRVTGDTWTMVSGDRSPACGSGTANSLTNVRLPAALVPTAPPTWAANASPAPSVAGGSSSAQPSEGSSASSSPTDGSGVAAAAGSDTSAAASGASTASVWPYAIALLGGTALITVVVAAWMSRRPTDNQSD